MRKRKYLLIAVLFLCTSFLGAQEYSASLVKRATAGLIEDGFIDDFDVGIDSATGIWFAGFNSKTYEFNFGYGTYFGPYWISIFDTGTFNANGQKVNSQKLDAVANDGVNIDYSDSFSNLSKNTTNKLQNEMLVSFANNKVGGSLYWFLNDSSINPSVVAKTDKVEDTPENGKLYKELSVSKDKNSINQIGVVLNGIQTKGNVSFRLDEVGVRIDRSAESDEINKSTSYFGTLDNTYESVEIEKDSTYTPYVQVSADMNLFSKGASETALEVEEFAEVLFHALKQTADTNKVTYTPTSEKTEITAESYDFANSLEWYNRITPIFTTSYNLGSTIKVKTSVMIPVQFKRQKTGNTIKKTVTDVTTLDKTSNLKTVVHNEKTELAGSLSQNTKTFITSVSPQTALGIVCSVKPGKFDLNLGARWLPGTYTWTSETKTNPTIITTEKETSTNEFGITTVTKDITTLHSFDGTSANDNSTGEKKTNSFTLSNASADRVWVGASLYLSESVKIDMLYSAGFTDFRLWGTGGLLESSLSLDFAVKF